MKNCIILIFAFATSACSPGNSNSQKQSENKTNSFTDNLRKIDASEIQNQINTTTKNLEKRFQTSLYHLHALRGTLINFDLPNKDMPTSEAVQLFLKIQDESFAIAFNAIDYNVGDLGMIKELQSDSICKNKYLRVYENSKFTYVAFNDNPLACETSLKQAAKDIQKVIRQFEFINSEKSQIAGIGHSINNIVQTELIQPVKIATVMGNPPNSVYAGFPGEIQIGLKLIRDFNAKLNQMIFIADEQNQTVSLNQQNIEQTILAIERQVDLLQILKSNKLSKQESNILTAQEKYLVAFKKFLNAN